MHDACDAITDALHRQGWAVQPGFVDAATTAALRERALVLDAAGSLTAAAIGRGAARAVNDGIRGDRTRWLGPPYTPAEAAYLARMAALRLACNRRLFLGLDTLEAHYALYPPGAAYARHSDNFRGQGARLLSCVLYLNTDWSAADGGQLRLYLPPDGQHDIMPRGGTLACFLSTDFEHEVLPARRPRLALTGWFRRRAAVIPD